MLALCEMMLVAAFCGHDSTTVILCRFWLRVEATFGLAVLPDIV